MTETTNLDHFSRLAFAYGQPKCSGIIKSTVDDFEVKEKLAFPLENKGDHAYLLIRKQNLNTEQVAKKLSALAHTKQVAIGYAGLKDKFATTQQWFSVDLSGLPEPDWSYLENNLLKINQVTRHTRKLRRGAITGNEFRVIIRSFAHNADNIEHKLIQIGKFGVPNYFGSQRFGHNESNLRNALSMFNGNIKPKNRHLRGIYLSAVRSFLFNLVLAVRVKNGSWNVPLPGDAMQLNGTNSFFVIQDVDEVVVQRTAAMDIHPSGPLFGRGQLPTAAEVAAIENTIKSGNMPMVTGLEEAGLKQNRRSLRAILTEFQWQFLEQNSLELKFHLPAGCYATSVIRELIRNPDQSGFLE